MSLADFSPGISVRSRFFKLPAELRQIHAMLRRFVLADEDHRDVPPAAILQNRILINVHFSQDKTEFAQNRRDGRFRLVAKMATGTRVKCDVAGPATGQSRVFRGVAHGLGFEYFMNGPECG